MAKKFDFIQAEIDYVQRHNDLPDAYTRMKWRERAGPEVAEAYRKAIRKANAELSSNRSDGIPFAAALVGTPFAIGLGKAAHDIYSKGYAASMVRDIPSFGRGQGSALDLAFLHDKATFFKSQEGAEIARRAWIEAVQSTDPLAKDILSFGDVRRAPYSQVFSSIEQTLQRNNSLFMATSYGKFKRNVGALTRHMEAVGTLPSFLTVENLKFPPPSNVAVNDLPPEMAVFYRKVKKIAGYADPNIQYYTRKPWQAEGFGVYRMSFLKGRDPFNVTIPMSRGGHLIEGLTLSSGRIAPGVDVFDPASGVFSSMSRHQFLMTDIEKSILPLVESGYYKSGWEIQRAINEAYQANIYALESVPNIPSNISPSGLNAMRRMRGQQIDIRVLEQMSKLRPGELYRSMYRPPTEAEFGTVMGTGRYFPFTSPKNLAEGRVSTFDPRGWSIFPEDVSFARQPRQAAREWRATDQAVAEMMRSGSHRWSIFETQAWRRDFGQYAAPHIRAIYIDPERYADVLSRIGMEPGEALIADVETYRKQLQVTGAVPSAHLKTLSPELAEHIASGKPFAGNIKFAPGEVLGRTPEGKLFAYEKGMKILGAEIFETTGKGQMATLFMERTSEPEVAGKYFKDLKAVMKRTPQQQMIEGISMLTAGMTPEERAVFSNFEGMVAFISADELRKDMSKKNTQIITGLWDMVDRRYGKDATNRSYRLAAFMQNPTVFASTLRAVSPTAESFQQAMREFAVQEANLPAAEVSALFADKGLSLGIFQPISGGPMELTGAGAMGSIEPRIFDLLRAGQYGTMGEEIAADLARRVALTEPKKVAAYEALTKTLRSVGGDISFAKGADVWDVSKGYERDVFQSWIEKGGGRLKIGGGIGDIFVPGGDVLKPFMTAGGNIVAGDLAQEYHTIANATARMYTQSKRIDLEEAKSLLQRFMANIIKQQAPFGKGAGAIERGKVLGSMFFRGVSKYQGRTAGAMTIGIPMRYGERMFEEMAAMGIYSPEELRIMQTTFRKGKHIGGLMARHPFIGPHSLQPVAIRGMTGIKEPVALMPSVSTKIKLAGAKEMNPISLSPLVGMAGDLDADIFSISLVSPDMEKKIRQQFVHVDNAMTRGYVENSVRLQLIKASAATDSASLSEINRMIADTQKLATTQRWVPRLSTQLSGARGAVGSMLRGQRAANAMFLLQWLEQVPISGKHLSAEKVIGGEMSSLFQSIEQGMKQGTAITIEDAVRGILRESDPEARRLLDEKVVIERGIENIRNITGVKSFAGELQAVNLRQATEDIVRAQELMKATGAEELSRIAAGRGRPSMFNLSKYLAQYGNLTAEKGAFASISKAAMITKNKIAALGMGLLEHKRAIGFGFVGSLALATILSKPPDLVGPGGDMIPDAKTRAEFGKARVRMQPEDIMPQSPPLGRPTPPRTPFITPNARIMPGSNMPSTSTRISAYSGGEANVDALVNRLRHIGGARRVNVNIRDNSKELRAHDLADKILR